MPYPGIFPATVISLLTDGRLLLQAPVYKLRLGIQGPPDQQCPESSNSLPSNSLNVLIAALSQWPAWVWLPPKLNHRGQN